MINKVKRGSQLEDWLISFIKKNRPNFYDERPSAYFWIWVKKEKEPRGFAKIGGNIVSYQFYPKSSSHVQQYNNVVDFKNPGVFHQEAVIPNGINISRGHDHRVFVLDYYGVFKKPGYTGIIGYGRVRSNGIYPCVLHALDKLNSDMVLLVPDDGLKISTFSPWSSMSNSFYDLGKSEVKPSSIARCLQSYLPLYLHHHIPEFTYLNTH